eukprot:scaffold87556_cov56-Phaeocystis_antarctica.AAC.1
MAHANEAATATGTTSDGDGTTSPTGAEGTGTAITPVARLTEIMPASPTAASSLSELPAPCTWPSALTRPCSRPRYGTLRMVT